MYKIVLSLFLLIFSLNSFAQEESENPETKEDPEYVIYDVIYLEGGRVLKGEIMSFDEASGTIVFKDEEERTYSIGKDEYKYFKENQSFSLTKKKDRILRERKNGDFSFQVGLGLGMFVSRKYLENNDYLINNGVYDDYDYPLTLKAAGGMFLNEKNFIGLTAEYAAIAYSDIFWSGGVRYLYYYDAQKSNLGLYLPVELQLTTLSASINNVGVDDTIYNSNGSSSWPAYIDIPFDLQSITLSLGQGFSAILANKKYLSLEFAFLTQFGLKEEYDSEVLLVPDKRFNGYGLKGTLLFGF